MNDEAHWALWEAQETVDDMDVSEFFGGERFNDLFETLSPEEVEDLTLVDGIEAIRDSNFATLDDLEEE